MESVRLVLERSHDDDLPETALPAAVAARVGLPLNAVREARLVRRALDARRGRSMPTWQLTVDAVLTRAPKNRYETPPPPIPRIESPRVAPNAPPVVVVGAGPAGLFAAWHLAERGARVTLVERGKPVETRARDFGRFRGRGELDPESNLCFGEGGAGTYSDGKLTCRTKDPAVREILERLVEVGAPARILVDAKPHIGTNLLFGVLKGLRARLLSLGVTLRFQERVIGLVRQGDRVIGVETNHGRIEAGHVLFAMGHSARDTFEMFNAAGIPLEPKPFAVGVRAEHPQALIDACQYRLRGPRPDSLPPADYRLSHTEGDRGVYSFCMCPGGMIVPTATELETVVVNGMSTARRSTPFANSGVVVQVTLDDLRAEGFGEHPLAGLEFQRRLEQRAFVAGGKNYFAPAIRARDFVRKKNSGTLPDSHFRPGLTPAEMEAVLPRFIVDTLRAGLIRFDRLIPGYGSADATLIAVESRTSSPVRVPRDPETRQVPGFPGLLVAGEGPGYAGGIMSAALDGLRTAQALLGTLANLPV